MRDENVYRKNSDGEFVPFGLSTGSDYLPDGIWYVHHYSGGHGTSNADYLAGLYHVADPSIEDIKRICGWEEISHYISHTPEYRELLFGDKGYSIQDIIRLTIEKTFEYCNKNKDNK